MKNILLLIVAVIPLLAFGQKNPNDKVMKKISIGKSALFFIKPFDYQLQGADLIKSAKGDITAVFMPDSGKEYVTVNISLTSAVAVEKLDSAVITTGKSFKPELIERFFCEPRKGNLWECRFSLRFAPQALLNWFSLPQAGILTLYSGARAAKLQLPALVKKYGPSVATQIRIETGWKNE